MEDDAPHLAIATNETYRIVVGRAGRAIFRVSVRHVVADGRTGKVTARSAYLEHGQIVLDGAYHKGTSRRQNRFGLGSWREKESQQRLGYRSELRRLDGTELGVAFTARHEGTRRSLQVPVLEAAS